MYNTYVIIHALCYLSMFDNILGEYESLFNSEKSDSSTISSLGVTTLSECFQIEKLNYFITYG